jgi:hypothetical protein
VRDPVALRNQGVAQPEGIGPFAIDQVANCIEIAQRLGHFLSIHLEESGMNPMPREGLTRHRFALRDLAFVVGEDQILAARV